MTNPERRSPLGRAADRKAVTGLPVIDVRPYVLEGSDEQRRRVAGEIRQACTDIGFFYVVGHGFSEAECAAMLESTRSFFALPLDRKMSVAVNERSSNLGFLRVGGLNPDASAAKQPDLKERLFLSRELMPGETAAESAPAGHSQWPAERVLPGFTAFVKGQIAKRIVLARALGRAFARSLELPENHFDRYYDRLGCMNALNYYPAQDVPAGAAPHWGFSPHTDYGSFTILLQDASGGLQARNSAGDWIDVPPIAGTFVVNIGDLMQRWTNDFYVSTLHRVVNTNAAARVSNSFFVYPDVHAEIRCLDTCQSPEHPARYKPVVSGRYIVELLAQAYSTGRVGISERTAERIQQSR